MLARIGFEMDSSAETRAPDVFQRCRHQTRFHQPKGLFGLYMAMVGGAEIPDLKYRRPVGLCHQPENHPKTARNAGAASVRSNNVARMRFMPVLDTYLAGGVNRRGRDGSFHRQLIPVALDQAPHLSILAAKTDSTGPDSRTESACLGGDCRLI